MEERTISRSGGMEAAEWLSSLTILLPCSILVSHVTPRGAGHRERLVGFRTRGKREDDWKPGPLRRLGIFSESQALSWTSGFECVKWLKLGPGVCALGVCVRVPVCEHLCVCACTVIVHTHV
jgi:hypothetical protein